MPSATHTERGEGLMTGGCRVTERLEQVVGEKRIDAANSDQKSDQHPPANGTVPIHDLAIFVPERLARAVERRRNAWTQIDTVAGWLIALHLVLLLVIVGRGSFYLDDLRAQGYAVNQPFWHFIV